MIDRFDLRTSDVRRSTVLQGPATGRSFISTAIVNDSINYADDLRKYPITKVDPASKTSQTTKRPIWVRTQTLS